MGQGMTKKSVVRMIFILVGCTLVILFLITYVRYSKYGDFEDAIRRGNQTEVKAFIDYGFDVNHIYNPAKEGCGYTPVQVAAQSKQPGVLKMLLENGGNPNHADNIGNTPLLVLVRGDETQDGLDCLELLLAANIH